MQVRCTSIVISFTCLVIGAGNGIMSEHVEERAALSPVGKFRRINFDTC